VGLTSLLAQSNARVELSGTREIKSMISWPLAPASIETGISEDSGFASMDCLKQDFDDVFKMFGEIPPFSSLRSGKLDVAKVAENSGIARRNDSVGNITARNRPTGLWRRLPIGPHHRVRHHKSGRTRGLACLHKKYYQPIASSSVCAVISIC